MKHSFLVTCIKQMIQKHFVLFLLLIVLLISSILMALLPAQILRYIIDVIINEADGNGLIKGAVFYFGVIILINLLEMMKESSFVIVGQTLNETICHEMMKKIQRIETSYFTKTDTALIASYFVNDAQTISSVFSNGVIAMIVSCFKILGIVISVAFFSKTLALILLIVLPIIFLLTRVIQKKMLSAQKKNRIHTANMTKDIRDSISTARIMKIFHVEKRHQNRFEKHLNDYIQNNERINFLDSVYSPLTQIIRAMIVVLIVFMASEYIEGMGLTIGMCAASIELMSQLFTPIENLGMELQSIQQAVSGIQRINAFYEEQEESIPRTKTMEDLFQGLEICLEFDHVSFAYDENSQILKNVSFTCDSNRKHVIVGRTGVGKSTMFHLIMGFYSPTKGEIKINGIHPDQIVREDMRKIFGLIDQNFMFIDGSIKDQITLKDPAYSEEQVQEVMKLCGLHEKIMALPQGYDTISSESLFSKGECQLLSIARALLSEPKILLLDEMSANLDAAHEKKMMEVIDQISHHRLILSITHHTNLIQIEDHVIYLKDGKRVDFLS